jgi:hypothetical protein
MAHYKGKPDKIKKPLASSGIEMFPAITADVKPLARARLHTSVYMVGDTACFPVQFHHSFSSFE